MGSADFMLIAGLFLAGFAAFLFVQTLLATNKDKQILSWANNDEPEKSKNAVINFSRPLVHQFTLQHAIRIKNEDYRASIAKLIMTSGLSRELNVNEFIGLQLLWGLLFPLFLLLMNFTLHMEFPAVVFLIFVPLGLYLPILHAQGAKNMRELNVRQNMPFFIDLLALSVNAGMDFFQAIQLIVDKSHEDNVLAQEFRIVQKDISLSSSKADALRGLAQRLDMGEISSFVAVLIDSEINGVPISKVLKDQADEMRLERFIRAEKAGNKATNMIMIPIMLLIVPAVFLLVLGSAALSLMGGG